MKHQDLDHEDDRIDLESPLGLADEPIVRSESDHLADENSEEAHRRRRLRALGEDGMDGNATASRDDHGGASSMDMGYGGEGTDVKGTK